MQHLVLLAPMAGVSDAAYRYLCIEHGADFTYSEMVSAKGLEYSSVKTKDLLKLAKNERKVGIQLFGRDPKSIADQGTLVQNMLADKLGCLDVNMGCPARKIVKKGDGSALMKEPALAAEIISSLKSAVDVPVTCKFRKGYDCDISLDFAKRMEDAGADAITIHGRYAMQYYKGEADWNCIKVIKENVSIPVIGNGDIRSGKDALSMIEQTNCDHVMVGRASEGNPWIFADIKNALEGNLNWTAPSSDEKIDMAIKHAKILSQEEGNLVKMRKHAAWYIKGIHGASAARAKLNSCTSVEDFESTLLSLKETIDEKN